MVEPHELGTLDSKYFQRLRHIKQMGFSEFSYPSATHSRYVHSLGAMFTASKVFDSIFHPYPTPGFTRFRAIARLAALLHDVGHGPLSHTTEMAMPPVSALQVPGRKSGKADRQATHEDYTLKIILDSGLTPILNAAGKSFGFDARHIAALIDPTLEIKDAFFLEKKVDYRPVLQQIISSELDADRMDYLRRDSLHAGVSYGEFDFDWIVANLTHYTSNGRCYLALQHRALYAFEDFLISRYHMFLMVYYHHKSVIFDEMLRQYFESRDCDYRLPSDIETYCDYNDAHLTAHLGGSRNPWARRISDNQPYRLLLELHSGIPATEVATREQQKLLEKTRRELKEKEIHFISPTSTGELSKYFRKPGDPIYVRYDNLYSAPSFIPLAKCTDLFQRYQEKRSITRVYVSPEDLKRCRRDGRTPPLFVD
ncbi:MAG: HD domain-containing protein [Bacteriovoracia bacterium]